MGMAPRSSRVVLSEINVTPLVDVMLVLLIVFMVTAPMLQQGFDVELPKTAAAGITTPKDPVILAINAQGKLALGKTMVSDKNLPEHLKTMSNGSALPPIYLQADRRTNYGRVAEVIALLKSEGITSISLITESL